MSSCPDCGCRTSDGICPNCQEELYILRFQSDYVDEVSQGFAEKARRQEKDLANARKQDQKRVLDA
jgi:hypothetical protein